MAPRLASAAALGVRPAGGIPPGRDWPDPPRLGTLERMLLCFFSAPPARPGGRHQGRGARIPPPTTPRSASKTHGAWLPSLALLPLLIGCMGVETPSVDGGMPPIADAGALPTAILTVETEPQITLPFGASATFIVRYQRIGGPTVGSAPVELALEGRAHDSSLSGLVAVTDDDGLAAGQILAGHTAAAFRIRVTALDARPLYIDVAVGDQGFGTVTVTPIYDGTRQVERIQLDAYARMQCEDDGIITAAPDRTTTLNLGQGSGRFFALPARLRYAIAARGLGPSGAEVAFGCTDTIVVEADHDSATDVVLSDHALDVAGTFATDVSLTPGATISLTTSSLRAAGHGPLMSSSGEADYLLDAIVTTVQTAGDPDGAAAISGDYAALRDALALRLDRDGLGPMVAVDALIAQLADQIARIHLGGQWTGEAPSRGVDPPTFGFAIDHITVSSFSAGVAPIEVDDLVLDLDPAPEVMATAVAGEDQLRVEHLVFGLPLGRLIRAVLDALVTRGATTDLTELLMVPSGCEALRRWAATQDVIAMACDGPCLRQACRDAIAPIAEAMEGTVTELDDARSAVDLGGDVELHDDSGDGMVDRMVAAVLSGAWHSADGSDSSAVAAELDAARFMPVP